MTWMCCFKCSTQKTKTDFVFCLLFGTNWSLALSFLSVTKKAVAKYDEFTVSVSQHQVSLEIQMIKTAALETNAEPISWLGSFLSYFR